jgi:hypothetical protein
LIYEDILLHHFPAKQEEYEKAMTSFEQQIPTEVENPAQEDDNSESSDDEVDLR